MSCSPRPSVLSAAPTWKAFLSTSAPGIQLHLWGLRRQVPPRAPSVMGSQEHMPSVTAAPARPAAHAAPAPLLSLSSNQAPTQVPGASCQHDCCLAKDNRSVPGTLGQDPSWLRGDQDPHSSAGSRPESPPPGKPSHLHMGARPSPAGRLGAQGRLEAGAKAAPWGLSGGPTLPHDGIHFS